MKFTILTSRGGLKMTKTFTEKEVYGYGLAKTFSCEVVEGGFEVLHKLNFEPTKCIIRGTPRSDVDKENFTRRLVNVSDDPLDWVLLDYDGDRPEYAPDLLENPEEAALSVLPEELSGVGFYWQLGSSAGIKKKYSIHIWIQLEEPLTSRIIKPAVKEWGFDGALCHPVQAHYVAAPVFYGIEDPVKRRYGYVPGDKAKIKPFIISHKAAEADRQIEMAILSRYEKREYTGPKTSIKELLYTSLMDLVTRSNGRIYECNCPRHQSETKLSLHIEPDKEKWFCHGCKRGGKTAYSLAYFVCNDDPIATKNFLRTSRG